MPVKANSQTLLIKNKVKITILLSFLILITSLLLAITLNPEENNDSPIIVLRIDDIQDFAFREAQLFLLSHAAENKFPLSLAVIAGNFGQDTEIVEAVKEAVKAGCEVTVHGWNHEDLAELSLQEQISLLFMCKNRLKDLLDVNPKILVPPMFSFNDDTIRAMDEEGYTLLSTCADLDESGSVSGIDNIPATVELSNYDNGIWQMKSLDVINGEVERSVELYGYAIMVTHPQEFTNKGALDPETVGSYSAIIQNLKENYSFNSLSFLNQERGD